METVRLSEMLRARNAWKKFEDLMERTRRGNIVHPDPPCSDITLRGADGELK